jgi:hypothetical protein
MEDVLKCYVSGRHLPGDKRNGIIAFAVPEFGLLFRCQGAGTRTDLEIIAFLSFLKFAEHNVEIFKRRHLLIQTDYPLLAFMLSGHKQAGRGAETLLRQARKTAKSLRFEVALIDTAGNRAAGNACDIPSVPAGAKLDIKTFGAMTPPPKPNDLSDGLKL